MTEKELSEAYKGNTEEPGFEEGRVILIDKPLEWTSFDVVKKVRNIIFKRSKKIKVGHAGTLDPLATGLLIICTGKLTKRIQEFQDYDKEYEGSLILGKTTPSYDLETEVNSETDISHIQLEDILNAAKSFVGPIMQVPPIFSAVKVNGERAYKLARRSEEAIIEAKQIIIHEFEITSINLPEVKFRVVCSKGTYIRSLVRDLGEALKVGAYMNSLRRTRIGSFSTKNAYQIEDFIKEYQITQ